MLPESFDKQERFVGEETVLEAVAVAVAATPRARRAVTRFALPFSGIRDVESVGDPPEFRIDLTPMQERRDRINRSY